MTDLPELIASLGQWQREVESRLAGLDCYRALQSVERMLADFPALDDLTQPLSEVRDRLRERLQESREYRAMQALQKIMPELPVVVALLAETDGDGRREDAAGASVPEDGGTASALSLAQFLSPQEDRAA